MPIEADHQPQQSGGQPAGGQQPQQPQQQGGFRNWLNNLGRR